MEGVPLTKYELTATVVTLIPEDHAFAFEGMSDEEIAQYAADDLKRTIISRFLGGETVEGESVSVTPRVVTGIEVAA